MQSDLPRSELPEATDGGRLGASSLHWLLSMEKLPDDQALPS